MKNTIVKKCPKCTAKYEGLGALSRRDNKTEICSRCGRREALQDYYLYLLKGKISQQLDMMFSHIKT